MTYIDLVYSPSSDVVIQQKIDYRDNLTIDDAMEESGLAERYPEIKQLQVGVFSNKVGNDYVLKPKDRIEIYRPLLACPKEKRRKRAKIKN
ncbi:MAG: RnfH family protein [Legionellaceae bacterium]|nr:RnfH family protein [Legionellaceae bacterium]